MGGFPIAFIKVYKRFTKVQLKVNMSNKVVMIPVITSERIDSDTLLEIAKGELESVVILGYDKKGQRYYASSSADAAEVIHLMERTKHDIFAMEDDLENGLDYS